MRRLRRAIGTTVIVVAVVIIIAMGTIAFVTLSSPSSSTSLSTTSAGGATTSTSSGSTPSGGGTTTTTSSNGGGTTTTSTSTSTLSMTTTTASVSNSSDGLQFSLQIKPNGGENITVTAEEVNLLSSVNNVTAAGQWKYPADLLDPFNNCAPGVDPVGFAIFQGNYGMNNYTSGKALPLYNTTIEYSCTVNFYPNEDVFQPTSDIISVYNDGQLRTNSTAVASVSMDGYWTGGEDTPAPIIFHSFGPGAYTVIGADTWGNVLMLHFSVTTTGITSTDSALLAECPGGQSSGFGFGTVTTGSTSPAVICVQLYYYNSVATLTLNITNALSIQAVQYIPNGSVDSPRSFNGASNFTVSSSQAQLIIGGPTNENEGTIVAYAVTAKAGASGTYELGFLSTTSLNNYMLGAQEPEDCGIYGQLAAGTGQPNYAQSPGGCLTYNTSSAGLITVPGIPYPLESGDLDFRIVGVTNSTT